VRLREFTSAREVLKPLENKAAFPLKTVPLAPVNLMKLLVGES
jgi:hypothetical protein